jgi:hypothetical protein
VFPIWAYFPLALQIPVIYGAYAALNKYVSVPIDRWEENVSSKIYMKYRRELKLSPKEQDALEHHLEILNLERHVADIELEADEFIEELNKYKQQTLTDVF